MEQLDWPAPMTLEDNLADMVMHAGEFTDRTSFTYSILDGDEVIGCVYIYPAKSDDFDAHVRSWVTSSRPEMDKVVWESLSGWLTEAWPFRTFLYSARV